MPQSRQRRYLEIAMRRGWFDEAAGARRWVTFIELLATHTDMATPLQMVNLFNLVAALPVVPDGLVLSPAQRALIYGTRMLDVTQLTRCVVELMHSPGGDGGVMYDDTHHLYHVLGGRACTPVGEAWLAQNWVVEGLKPVALLEPFGTEPWDMVSELGLNSEGVLVAYHRIENLSAELTPGPEHALNFDGDSRRHEPADLRQPDVRTCTHRTQLAQSFSIGYGMRAGISTRGALAIFAEVSL